MGSSSQEITLSFVSGEECKGDLSEGELQVISREERERVMFREVPVISREGSHEVISRKGRERRISRGPGVAGCCHPLRLPWVHPPRRSLSAGELQVISREGSERVISQEGIEREDANPPMGSPPERSPSLVSQEKSVRVISRKGSCSDLSGGKREGDVSGSASDLSGGKP